MRACPYPGEWYYRECFGARSIVVDVDSNGTVWISPGIPIGDLSELSGQWFVPY